MKKNTGTRVRVRALPEGSPLARRVQRVSPSGIRRFFEMVIGMEDILSLAVGEPDFVAPWRVREAAIFSLEEGDTSYTSNWGLLELRQAIAGKMRRDFGVDYDPRSQIVVTAGVSEGLDLAIRSVTDPGDEVLLVEPAYVSYAPTVHFAEGTPVPVAAPESRGFIPRTEDIRRAITPRTKAILLNYPNNPTGAVLGRREMEGIAELAEDHDLLIITDEVYSDLTYEGRPRSMAPLAPERTILLNGFSKGYAMTGFRIGYICAPPDLAEGMMKVHQYTMLCAPITGQRAALEALKSDTDVREMVREYDRRRRFLMEGFRRIGIPCVEPKGAFYAFPNIVHTGLASEEFAERLLREQKVAVVPGSAFGPTGEGHLRVSYAVEIENLQTALQRLEKFLQGLRKSPKM